MGSLVTRSGLFDDFFRDMSPGFFVRPLSGDPLPSPDQIKIDVRESDGEYKIDAEIPGVRKEDISVSVDGDMVTLSAEVKQETTNGKDEKNLRTERYYGSVSRSFSLPQDVDAARSQAKYEGGVLHLTLPKSKSTRMQRLAVS
jgi:HSP20 family protein